MLGYIDERVISTVSSFQLTRSARLGLAHRISRITRKVRVIRVVRGLYRKCRTRTAEALRRLAAADPSAFSSYIVDAKDGGKKAIAQRDKQGAEVLRMIRAMALYVELNCKEDMNVFLRKT